MAEKKNGEGRGMGKGWTAERDKRGKRRRRAEGKGEERGIKNRGKVRDRGQRGDDRRKSGKSFREDG